MSSSSCVRTKSSEWLSFVPRDNTILTEPSDSFIKFTQWACISLSLVPLTSSPFIYSRYTYCQENF